MMDEFNQPTENDEVQEFCGSDEFNTVHKAEYTPKKSDSKVRKMVYLVTAVLSVAVVTNAVDPDFSILKGLNGKVEEHYPDEPGQGGGDDGGNDKPDDDDRNPSFDGVIRNDEFPKLGNLEPNGSATGYGVLDEEYVFLRVGNDLHYLHAGKKYLANGTEIEEVKGAYYDLDSNTLTLRDVTADQLNVNMMGNGFTVKLEGVNRIGEVLVWGFFYGGSITFTGDGTLIASGSGSAQTGIILEAEYSDSCIMVDSNVTLDISGENGAILINNSSEEQGLYCHSPQVVSGGNWERWDSSDAIYSFKALDDDGNYSKRILIEPYRK